MKKTPEKVSEERQKIGRELEAWRESLKRARADLGFGHITSAQCAQQVAFCEKELTACRKRMAALRHKGKKTWTFKAR